MKHIHEECGVFGIYSQQRKDVATLSYYALYSLQHRGQESAGIVVNDDGILRIYKDKGLVSEVFSQDHLSSLPQGHIAIGHVRYGTTGLDAKKNAQPICINHMKGNLALAHNGNLVNSYELRKELESTGSIFYTTSDTESIVYTIVKERLTSKSIEEAVFKAVQKLEGAFSLVISSPSKLIAVRDPHGFRPLCMGKREDGDIVFASETCALDAVGAHFVRDILPGEIVTVSAKGIQSNKSLCETCKKSLCAFEYIYFERSDSMIDGY
ncbi:amidophosphoribosyltransferase, partial [Floccifex sp.]|uniref:amidophosphoribosyltransferase n=1 Tax=Floccifex sp. TaxID=2815810 RepID=UPI003F114323